MWTNNQKLFTAFKEKARKLAKEWNELRNDEEWHKTLEHLKKGTLSEEDNEMLEELKKKQCSNWNDSNYEKNTETFLRYKKVKGIEKMASGLRSSLLKDIGTRSELRNLPLYNEIFIEEPLKVVIPYHQEYLEFEISFFGSQILDLKNKEILLQITDLDTNEPKGVEGYYQENLKPGQKFSVKWYPSSTLEPGNYSVRIVANVVTSKSEFIIISEKPFNYPPKKKKI